MEDRATENRINWKVNARKIYDAIRAAKDPGGEAWCYFRGKRLAVLEAGFGYEPADGPPGTIVKMTPRGVEVVTGAGVVVLRRVRIEGEEEEAAIEALMKAGAELHAVLG
jgi:methionyl-tRNA formyltransferase